MICMEALPSPSICQGMCMQAAHRKFPGKTHIVCIDFRPIESLSSESIFDWKQQVGRVEKGNDWADVWG